MMVKVGDSCTLSGRYSGKPAPAITWTKNDEALKADEEISLHSTARHLSLNISKAKREHSGHYQVSVENAAGSRTGVSTIIVVGESPLQLNWSHFTGLKIWFVFLRVFFVVLNKTKHH